MRIILYRKPSALQGRGFRCVLRFCAGRRPPPLRPSFCWPRPPAGELPRKTRIKPSPTTSMPSRRRSTPRLPPTRRRRRRCRRFLRAWSAWARTKSRIRASRKAGSPTATAPALPLPCAPTPNGPTGRRSRPPTLCSPSGARWTLPPAPPPARRCSASGTRGPSIPAACRRKSSASPQTTAAPFRWSWNIRCPNSPS